ncbi:MAG: hypothetical protein H6878_13955 [Rhodobiaceae bacterium]|nr:hypothetical protein [Paracoccaceae bacterium]MCC0017367.1 hypothetical protein [Rhodobiaceae bacterium]MCC0041823.1 hypothetical protein [Rhodobiaceae bacterium]MCC0052539.1 hypothetical protein [Rhodobiaceae bacterium]
MNALTRLIMKAMMWGAFLIGLVLSALSATVWFAIQGGNGAEGGVSAGQNPEAGLAVMGGLALVAFVLAFVVRREIRKHGR